MTDSQTAVRALMREATEHIEGPVDLAAVGERARRYRRTRLALGAGGAVALSAAVAAGAIGLGPPAGENDGSVGQPSATSTSGPGLAHARMTAYQWAATLPRGDDARAAYYAAGVLHIGSTALPMGEDTSVIIDAPTRDGWLASSGQLDKQSLPSHNQAGIIHADGSFAPFAYQWERPLPFAYDLSPDGTKVAMGDVILDLSTGERIRSLPADVYYVIAWTDAGIVYTGPQMTRTYLWSPTTGDATLLGRVPVMRPDGLGLARDNGCENVVRLRPEGSLTTLASFCDRDVSVASLSPSGDRVVARRTAAVLDVPTGAVVGTLPFREFGSTALFWEDEDHIVFDVQGGLNRHFDFRWLLVRCTVSTHSCERASGPFTGRSEPVLVPLTYAEGRHFWSMS